MSVDYKVKFTISGETLFALFAKMLPIDNVSIEELPTKPTLAERAIAVNKITARAIENHKGGRGGHRKANLDMGINKIIMDALAERPMRAVELQPLVTGAGWSPNSVNSRLEVLRMKGVIERVGDGTWRRHVT